MLDPMAALMQFVKDGKLRPLAVTGERRFFALPDVPTVVESGVPDMSSPPGRDCLRLPVCRRRFSSGSMPRWWPF
jgi:hypothetical protein